MLEEDKIKQCLQDIVDAARLQGMSEAGIQEGRKMIMKEFPDIWRILMGSGDFAGVPLLKQSWRIRWTNIVW